MTSVEDSGTVLPDRDRRLIAEDQPELRYVPAADGSATFIGDFIFKLQSGSPQRIPTRIEFTTSYPEEEPRAVHVGSGFRHDGDHHFYSDGRCCLWLDVETRWKPSDPQKSLQRFLDELKVFYLRQLMMEANPKLTWPGRARGHGFEGHLEHLQERLHMPLGELPMMLRALDGAVSRNAPCPCGRRVRYRKCHRDAIVRFRKLADPRSQADVVRALRQIRAANASRRASSGTRQPSPSRSAPSPGPVRPGSRPIPAGTTIGAVLARAAMPPLSRAPA